MQTFPLVIRQLILLVAVLLISCGEKELAFTGDANARNSSGDTLLMQAIAKQDLSRLDLLLNSQADPELKDEKGDTVLTHAVRAGQLPAVTRLLQAGADPQTKVSLGGDLVVEALRQKQLAMTYLLIKHGAPVNSSHGAQGESLIQAATEMGNVSLLRDLKKRGAHPKTDPGNGHGLLHVAFEQNQDRVLAYLLSQGLDPNRPNSKQETPLQRVVGKKGSHLISLLAQHGANLNQANTQGWLPLQVAIRQGDEATVRALLSEGAQVDLLSEHEQDQISSLELAFDEEQMGIARILLENKAPVRDELYQAVKVGGERGLEIVQLLIEFNASMDPDRVGDSPLTRAVREDQDEIVRSLLEAGAPQDRPGLTGQKPFHLAVAKGDNQLTELLLKHGADPNEPYTGTVSEDFLKHVKSEGVIKWAFKKSTSLRPLMIAADSGNVPLAQLLMKHGASSGKSSRVGRHRFWPLSFAARRQDTDLQQVLFNRPPGKTKRWIKVNLSSQRLTMYEGEKAILSSPISSGRKGNRTKTGKFVISNKYRNWTSTLYNSEMPYFHRLSGGDFGFHYGVLPGYPASHGCIRMPMSKVKKLYSLTRTGDYVEIVK